MGGKAGKSTKPKDTTNEPWIENYPPLRDFLREIEARCDWQVKLPYHGGAYAEQWRAPGGLQFIVVVLGHQAGWEIYTPGASVTITKTIEDAKARIFPPKAGT